MRISPGFEQGRTIKMELNAMAEYSSTVFFEAAEEGGLVATCPALPGPRRSWKACIRIISRYRSTEVETHELPRPLYGTVENSRTAVAVVGQDGILVRWYKPALSSE